MTDSNIIKLPDVLDQLAAGIKADLARTEYGRQEWIEGTLGLAVKLAEARGAKSNKAFSAWLAEYQIEINHQDRAALINMAQDIDLAREILTASDRTSWRHIWEEEMLYRFTQAGKTIQETKNTGDNTQSILAAIKDSPAVPGRELAERLGVSHGKVQRERRKLAEEALGKTKRPKPTGPSLAEQQAIRNSRPRFDDKTREERGMGSKEYGAEQHPDYPPGWTRDVVHREKYGRIQLFTPDQQEERNTVATFTEILGHLRSLAETLMTVDLGKVTTPKTREMVIFQITKLAPKVIEELSSLLDHAAAHDRISDGT